MLKGPTVDLLGLRITIEQSTVIVSTTGHEPGHAVPTVGPISSVRDPISPSIYNHIIKQIDK